MNEYPGCLGEELKFREITNNSRRLLLLHRGTASYALYYVSSPFFCKHFYLCFSLFICSCQHFGHLIDFLLSGCRLNIIQHAALIWYASAYAPHVFQSLPDSWNHSSCAILDEGQGGRLCGYLRQSHHSQGYAI